MAMSNEWGAAVPDEGAICWCSRWPMHQFIPVPIYTGELQQPAPPPAILARVPAALYAPPPILPRPQWFWSQRNRPLLPVADYTSFFSMNPHSRAAGGQPAKRKRRKATTNTEEFKITIDDVLWEIFLGLDLKSLFRCAKVCKLFNSIVSNPVFRTMYIGSSNRNTSGEPAIVGFFAIKGITDHNTNTPPPSYSVRFVPYGDNNRRIPIEKDELKFVYRAYRSILKKSKPSTCPFYRNKIFASSGGLLLCSGYQYESDMYGYYILNPMTNDWQALPTTDTDRSRPDTLAVGFVCQESDPDDYYYTVVRIHEKDGVYVIETYTSMFEDWSVVCIPSDFPWLLSSQTQMIAIGGVFCWMYVGKFHFYDPVTSTIEHCILPGYPPGKEPCLGGTSNGEVLLYMPYDEGLNVHIKKDCWHEWNMYRQIKWSEIEVLAQNLPPCVAKPVRLRTTSCWAFQGIPDKVFLESHTTQVFSFDLMTMKVEMVHDGDVPFRMSKGIWHPYSLPSWRFKL